MHEKPERPRATIEQRLKAYHKIMDWKEEERKRLQKESQNKNQSQSENS